jgi:phosphoglycerate dehydrogenase-like enzyme
MSLTILIASYLEPEHVARIQHEFPDLRVLYRPDLVGQPRYIADHTGHIDRTPEQESEWQSLLAQADILFDFDHSHRRDLPELAPRLKWIQATSAGIGQFVHDMQYHTRTNWLFTTASGVHARPLAEFAIMGMLMFAKNFPHLAAEQAKHHWERFCATDLTGKTVAIVGLGSIGEEIARLAKAFDMVVIGNRRDPSLPVAHVDQLYAPADLHLMLPRANFLVLATPQTPETERMIAAPQIDLLPRGAVIINVGRGVLIDEPAMVAALQSGKLGGAVLDVFATEPLPSDSPLWDMPNVFVSPHSASTVESENERIVDIFCENLRRYQGGERLYNLLDVEKRY